MAADRYCQEIFSNNDGCPIIVIVTVGLYISSPLYHLSANQFSLRMKGDGKGEKRKEGKKEK